MRILIDIEGGLVQGVHVDPDHDKELEVHLIDRDGPENGDARYVGEIACTVDTPAEFDAIIEEAEKADAEDELEAVQLLAGNKEG